MPKTVGVAVSNNLKFINMGKHICKLIQSLINFCICNGTFFANKHAQAERS